MTIFTLMKPLLTYLLVFITLTSYSQQADTLFMSKVVSKYIDITGKLVHLEMHLSAFGVESDDFPDIVAHIDFKTFKGECHRSYDNPAYQPTTYYIDSIQVRAIMVLLQNSNLNALNTNYSTNRTDQPTSTTIIYTTVREYTIKDYGLDGDKPLPELYKLVYRIEP